MCLYARLLGFFTSWTNISVKKGMIEPPNPFPVYVISDGILLLLKDKGPSRPKGDYLSCENYSLLWGVWI